MLQPAQVGVFDAGRRHVHGLRRSEVANIANISVTWYSMLEQGRATNVSLPTLDAIAAALQFGSAERDYMRELTGGTSIASDSDVCPPIALLEFAQTVSFGLAFILSPSFDVITYNEQADEMFAFTEHGSGANLLKIMIANSRIRSRFVMPSFDDALEAAIAHFRFLHGRYGGAASRSLVDELAGYQLFAHSWNGRTHVPSVKQAKIRLPDGTIRDIRIFSYSLISAPTYTFVLGVPLSSVNGSDRLVFQRKAQAIDTPQVQARRYAEFGAFLRCRRNAIRPQDIGLVTSSRRHARGLRRGEVASRAGISVSRYTMLEQGSIGTLPARTLEAVAKALLLEPRERAYLTRLGTPLLSLVAQELLLDADLLEFLRTYALTPSLPSPGTA